MLQKVADVCCIFLRAAKKCYMPLHLVLHSLGRKPLRHKGFRLACNGVTPFWGNPDHFFKLIFYRKIPKKCSIQRGIIKTDISNACDKIKKGLSIETAAGRPLRAGATGRG